MVNGSFPASRVVTVAALNAADALGGGVTSLWMAARVSQAAAADARPADGEARVADPSRFAWRDSKGSGRRPSRGNE